jgi:hypothetical protein
MKEMEEREEKVGGVIRYEKGRESGRPRGDEKRQEGIGGRALQLTCHPPQLFFSKCTCRHSKHTRAP